MTTPEPTHLAVIPTGDPTLLQVIQTGTRDECYHSIYTHVRDRINSVYLVDPDTNEVVVNINPQPVLLVREGAQYPTTPEEIHHAFNTDPAFHAFVRVLQQWLRFEDSESATLDWHNSDQEPS